MRFDTAQDSRMDLIFNSLQPFFTFANPMEACTFDPPLMKKVKGTNKGLPGHGLRVASLFTGAGGPELGFHDARFDVVRPNEVERTSCWALRASVRRLVSDHIR